MMSHGRLAVTLAIALASTSGGGGLAADWTSVDAGRGPVAVRIPPGYDAATPAPLLVLLHGFGASGALEEAYLGLGDWTDAWGFLYALPDGTTNPQGKRFWNATDACCDTYGSNVDDSGYLRGLIEGIAAALAVDRHRVFVVGHSNGGFMAYRLACDAASDLAAVVSLAGATFFEASQCAPSRAVSVLQVHGTADNTILYGGGVLLAPYPGAEESVTTWAEYNGCIPGLQVGGQFDADYDVAGEEAAVFHQRLGCRGGDVELWRLEGSGHLPDLTDSFRDRLLGWLWDRGVRVFADGFETGTLDAWSVRSD